MQKRKEEPKKNSLTKGEKHEVSGFESFRDQMAKQDAKIAAEKKKPSKNSIEGDLTTEKQGETSC